MTFVDLLLMCILYVIALVLLVRAMTWAYAQGLHTLQARYSVVLWGSLLLVGTLTVLFVIGFDRLLYGG
jgi:hypothetical protein